jgi:transposase
MPKGVYRRRPDLGDRISDAKKPGYSAIKKQARALYLEGVTPKNIARQLGVPKSTVKNWVVGLPKQSTGLSTRPRGFAAGRIARATGRDGEDIRQEMLAKEHDPCFFCGSEDYEDQGGWFNAVYHHEDNGQVHRAHNACNICHRHASKP